MLYTDTYIPVCTLKAAFYLLQKKDGASGYIHLQKLERGRIAFISVSSSIMFAAAVRYSGDEPPFEHLPISGTVVRSALKERPPSTFTPLAYNRATHTYFLRSVSFKFDNFPLPDYKKIIPSKEELCNAEQIGGEYDPILLKICADVLRTHISGSTRKGEVYLLQRGDKPAVMYTAAGDALCLIAPRKRPSLFPKFDFS